MYTKTITATSLAVFISPGAAGRQADGSSSAVLNDRVSVRWSKSRGALRHASKTPSGVKRAPFERRDKTGLLLVCHRWGGGAQRGVGEVESGGVGMDKSWERGRGRGRDVFFSIASSVI